MILSEYKAVAHRGLHDISKGIPENSLAAFQRAVEVGAAIEIDVRLTCDNVAVVFHDDSLERMTGVIRPVEDCSWEELKELRLQDTRQGIPLLAQVLSMVGGRVPLLIELKDNGLKGRLAEEAMRQLRGYRGRYMVQSFNPLVLLQVKRIAPYVRRGQLSQKSLPKEKEGGKRFLSLVKEALRKNLLGNVNFNGITKPDFIAYRIKDLTAIQAHQWEKQGYGLLAWTVHSQEQLNLAAELCQGAIFEGMDYETVKRRMEG